MNREEREELHSVLAEAHKRKKLSTYASSIKGLLDYYASHPAEFLADNVKIVDSITQQQIPFTLNEAQQEFFNTLFADDVQFVVVPKGRQLGITTASNGAVLHHLLFTPNAAVAVVAHKETKAAKNLERIRKMFHSMPEWMQFATVKESARDRDSINIWRFTSRYTKTQVEAEPASANSPDSIRGDGLSFVHWTEVCFCDAAEENYTSVRPIIKRRPGSKLVLESTAEGGPSGLFYDACVNYPIFNVIFLPWYLEASYRHPPEKITPEQRLHAIEVITEEVADTLDEEQIAFYADLIANETNLIKVLQEYPSTLHQAFSSGDNLFFAMSKINELEERGDEYDVVNVTQYGFEPAVVAPGKVFERPTPNVSYTIGCDIAEGRGGDFTVFVVMKANGEQVFQWRDNYTDLDQQAAVLHSICKQYNEAFIVLERDPHSTHVMMSLVHKYRYPDKLFCRDHSTDGRIGLKPQSRTTKIERLNALQSAINDNAYIPLGEEFVDEARSFIVFDRFNIAAKKGHFDDVIDAHSAAYYGLKQERPSFLQDTKRVSREDLRPKRSATSFRSR